MQESLTFEKSLEELENIVARLEKEDCSLNDAIELFEKGVKLTKKCNDELNKAKLKIDLLTKEYGNE